VVAASTEDELVTALRLGIGGAMTLPPSSVGATEAFAAAASSAEPTAGHDSALFELLENSFSAVILSFSDRRFWLAQLGERRLTTLLAELAAGLAAPAAILPWPALVVVGKEPEEVVEIWSGLFTDDDRLVPDVAAIPLEQSASREGLLVSAYREILKEPPAPAGGGCRPLPVHELPRGLRVGWWRRRGDGPSPGGGWCAWPHEVARAQCTWRLEGDDGPGDVVEVLTGEDVDRPDQAVAVRFPGWASRDVRPGSPAGLLVTRLAEAAARRGLPLWIPNLDSDALRLALTLPGVLWVDGPAVPR
jgi:hypothetical protein